MTAMFLAAGILDQARETAEQFGWEPKLFLSQVISFIIVALVLKRFAYKPILAVLEQRRQQIADAQLNAEKIKQQLVEAEQRHAEILAKANAQAQKMIDEARESAGHVEKRTATIETATELPSDAQQQIVENLKRKYGSDLTARFAVNPELLGGMRIRVGSDVWDSSVRNRLQRLQQQL